MSKRFVKNELPMADIFVVDWNNGYKASIGRIPGCVFRHRDENFAVWMVAQVSLAMTAELKADKWGAPN